MITGTEIVIQNIGMIQSRFDKVIKRNVGIATDKVYKRVLKNIGLTCHSLKRLAEMGHPYALKDPRVPHSPIYLVHKQSANLRESIGKKVQSLKSGTSGYIFIDEEKAPYARYVILGTSKMIPRDFLSGSLEEMKDEVFEIIRKGLIQVIIERRR